MLTELRRQISEFKKAEGTRVFIDQINRRRSYAEKAFQKFV